MKRRHSMPFGAECLEDGKTRFRLWAPAAATIELCLERSGNSVEIPLERQDGGWFEAVTDAAPSGSNYRYQVNKARKVPDPGSRFQPQDVHGPSEVIDPENFDWQDSSWRGRPWEEAVIYELHVGAFTERGTFDAARERLDHLAQTGITALELMPVADFPGKRNWGYDGVLPFAPDSSYGKPEELKALIQDAHSRGIMVLLDVVYNHFGPEGNYLNAYAPQFFTDRHCTPWGNGINFDGAESRVVRDFFIHNALYWLTEFHFDGLRLDAVHAIADDSTPDILTELAMAVRNSLSPDRHVHLVLENERNQSRYLLRGEDCRPETYDAQWNDDIHHAFHVLTTGERDGYYTDYAERPLEQLGRCLTEGFAYQGDLSRLRGETRGELTTGVPLTAFVSFLQNHDQIGNRAFGERITELAKPNHLRAALAILLLAPSPPLLFMGEEYGAETPFLFFCDFEKDLARAVTAGRRNEFARFGAFNDPGQRERIPDPNAATTFEKSRLDWTDLSQPLHREWIGLYQELLKVRADFIVPCLAKGCCVEANYQTTENSALTTRWTFPGTRLTLLANVGDSARPGFRVLNTPPIYASAGVSGNMLERGTLPAWSVAWFLES